MSDVEKFYEAARKYFPNSKPWNSLSAGEKQKTIIGISLILGVLN